MEKGELLQYTRWDILQQISRGHATPIAIANAAKTSVPNVSQQLRLLEAHNLVDRHQEKRKGPGKPQHKYALKKPFCHLTYAREGFAEQLFIHPGEFQNFFFSVLFVPVDEQPFLMKLLFDHGEVLDSCSVAYVRSTESIEILLVTEDVERIRKKYSNVHVTFGGKSRKIVAWTHSVEELREGIARKEEYFLGLMKHKLLHDPDKRLHKVME